MWILYSLLTALFLATSDALTKRALFSRDAYFIAWARLVFALPVLAVSLLFVDIPQLDRTFWGASACALPLEIAALILYTKALKASPISLTMPFLSLTPVFLIAMSYVILGERVSLMGAAGIFLVAVGSYTLNIHTMRQSILEPFRAIIRERGVLYMIIVAFIYSFTSSLGKMAIEHSSPVFFGSSYFIVLTALFTPIAAGRSSGRMTVTKKDIVPLAAIGTTFALMIIFHMLAMSMANVAYMISIKRTSLLFSILYGHILFSEQNIGEKAAGGIIMLAGFVLIVVSR
ncbi:MAG: EamA family transporter [Nitrospiraceae bacterium]|nr:MAG: EamA family transporter [Nitrospiraceae bacterium]